MSTVKPDPVHHSPESPNPPTTGTLKVNVLGTSDVVFLVVSAAAPLTVMAGVAPIGIMIGGVGAPLAYLAAGIVLALFAAGFIAMTRYVSKLGGFYVYVTEALGRRLGLSAAFIAVVSYNAIQIGLYGLLGSQVSATITLLTGIEIPWWIIALAGIIMVWILAARGVDVGAKVLAALLILETAVLVVLAAAVLLQGGAQGITFGSAVPENLFNPGMIPVMAIAFGAFLGFESTVLYREEVRSPRKTIPRATIISVSTMAIFYTFMTWIVIIAFGDDKAQSVAGENPEAMFFVAMERYVGTWGTVAMYVLLITSLYAALLAFHNAVNRYTFVLARDGLLPAPLALTHPVHGSPRIAGLAQSALAVLVVAVFALAGADPYLQLLLWVNSAGVLGLLFLQGLTCIGVVAYLWKKHDVPRKTLVLLATVLAGVGMLSILTFLFFNLDLLTAGGPVVNAVIIAVLPVTGVIGLISATLLQRKRPEAFQRIGGADS